MSFAFDGSDSSPSRSCQPSAPSWLIFTATPRVGCEGHYCFAALMTDASCIVSNLSTSVSIFTTLNVLCAL